MSNMVHNQIVISPWIRLYYNEYIHELDLLTNHTILITENHWLFTEKALSQTTSLWTLIRWGSWVLQGALSPFSGNLWGEFGVALRREFGTPALSTWWAAVGVTNVAILRCCYCLMLQTAVSDNLLNKVFYAKHSLCTIDSFLTDPHTHVKCTTVTSRWLILLRTH